jgi:Cu-processing system permease protein
VSPVLVIARYAIQEAVRRRVFTVVLALTAAFVVLYGLAVWQVFRRIGDIHPPGGIEPKPFAGATIFGLSMFATMFLGVVLGVFLTLGVVRGDAERGLLQPLLVRPLSRTQLLLGRLLAAAAVCTAYVACVYTALMLVTGLIGHWWPDRIALPALELAVGVSIVAAISLLGSVFLSATANGIAVFMVFGSGLIAGLLGSIGQVLDSGTLKTASRVVSWALPF